MSGEFLYPNGSLPPKEVRLIDPHENPLLRISTPVDDRGLIVIPELIKKVAETIDPEYEWPNEYSMHHVYYWDYLYRNEVGPSGENPARFRNLPVHKIIVPRQFENWLHEVTVPAPVPEPQVMRDRTDAWDSARNLFTAARKTLRWEKLARLRRELIAEHPEILDKSLGGQDTIGEEIIYEQTMRSFRGFNTNLNRYSQVPHEQRLVNVDGRPADVVVELGRVVNIRALNHKRLKVA